MNKTILPLVLSLALAACETENPTKLVVDNAYPAPGDASNARANVVYRLVWGPTYHAEPLLPGESSSELRTVPDTSTAYALVAPGWDPASGAAPTSLVVMRSKELLSVARGDTLHVTVSDRTFRGSCDASDPLSQDETDFVTQRIFPADFEGATYDAKTCARKAAAADAGAE